MPDHSKIHETKMNSPLRLGVKRLLEKPPEGGPALVSHVF